MRFTIEDKDYFLQDGDIVELPSENEHIKMLVHQSYLKEQKKSEKV